MKKIREANFEILRILAMLMIIGAHLASHGVLHRAAEYQTKVDKIFDLGSGLNKLVVSLLRPGGEIGVAIFL